MTWRHATLAVLAPWLGACAATLRTSGTTRLEQVRSSVGAESSTLRVSPVATLTGGRGADAAAIEVSPQLLQGGISGTRLRAAAHWTGRGVVHPSTSASIEQGMTRTSDLLGDTIAPLPAVTTLSVRQLRGAAGMRIDRGRRLQFGARLDAASSEGLGASAGTLPRLASSSLEGRVTWNATRHLLVGATLRTSSERVGDAPALAITRATGALQWAPMKSIGITASTGLVATGTGGAQPILELGVSHRHLTSGVRIAAQVARGPEVDRLDGSLTDRLRTRVRVETPLVPHVSFGGTLQQASDLGGIRQSVVRNGDTGLTFDLGSRKTLEIGVARFQQYMGGKTTNAETRAFLQFTLARGR